MSSALDQIDSAVSALSEALVERAVRLDRIGVSVDDPALPSVVVRVKHGKILDIAAKDSITRLTVGELEAVLNGVIFGAFADWRLQVAPPGPGGAI